MYLTKWPANISDAVLGNSHSLPAVSLKNLLKHKANDTICEADVSFARLSLAQLPVAPLSVVAVDFPPPAFIPESHSRDYRRSHCYAEYQ